MSDSKFKELCQLLQHSLTELDSLSDHDLAYIIANYGFSQADIEDLLDEEEVSEGAAVYNLLLKFASLSPDLVPPPQIKNDQSAEPELPPRRLETKRIWIDDQISFVVKPHLVFMQVGKEKLEFSAAHSELLGIILESVGQVLSYQELSHKYHYRQKQITDDGLNSAIRQIRIQMRTFLKELADQDIIVHHLADQILKFSNVSETQRGVYIAVQEYAGDLIEVNEKVSWDPDRKVVVLKVGGQEYYVDVPPRLSQVISALLNSPDGFLSYQQLEQIIGLTAPDPNHHHLSKLRSDLIAKIRNTLLDIYLKHAKRPLQLSDYVFISTRRGDGWHLKRDFQS